MDNRSMEEQNQSQNQLKTGIVSLTDNVVCVAENNSDIQKKEEGKQTSRVVTTGLFGFLGAKIGAAKGGILGTAYHGFKRDGSSLNNKNIYKHNKALSSLAAAFKEGLTGGSEPLTKMELRTGMGALIGGVVGALTLGGIGWARGNRIEKPMDLIEHPLQSLGKMFSSDKKTLSSGKENSEYWQNKVAQAAIKDENVSVVAAK